MIALRQLALGYGILTAANLVGLALLALKMIAEERARARQVAELERAYRAPAATWRSA